MLILFSTWTVLKNLMKKKLPDKECLYSSLKDGTTGEKLGGHISDQDYLSAKKFGINLTSFEKRSFVISRCF